MLKELIIPYSYFPIVLDPNEKLRENQELLGTVDFEDYPKGAFVYCLFTGYHYNFIVKNKLFRGIKILREITYTEMALSNFNFAMDSESLGHYISDLQVEAEEWKERDPSSVVYLRKLLNPPDQEFALFGLLAASPVTLFNAIWGGVQRLVMQSLTTQRLLQLSVSRMSLDIPDWLRGRFQVDLNAFLRNTFTVPDWVRNRIQLPFDTDLMRRMGIGNRGFIQIYLSIFDSRSNLPVPYRLNGENLTNLSLPGANVQFVPFPSPVHGTDASENGISMTPLPLMHLSSIWSFIPPTVKSALGGVTEGQVTENGWIRKQVWDSVTIFGRKHKFTYGVCLQLNNNEYYISKNGFLPVLVCLGNKQASDFPQHVVLKNKYVETAAGITFARKKSIEILKILPKKAKVVQGAPILSSLPNTMGVAPCGLLPEVIADAVWRGYRKPISSQGHYLDILAYEKYGSMLTLATNTLFHPIADADILISPNENIFVTIHEYSHIIHCSQIGKDKYREQLIEYVKDIQKGINLPAIFGSDIAFVQSYIDRADKYDGRKTSYAYFHEGVANFYEYLISSNMNYCASCTSIEENLDLGLIRYEIYLRELVKAKVFNTESQASDFLVEDTKDFQFVLNSILYTYATGDRKLISEIFSPHIVFSSLLYDFADNCVDSNPESLPSRNNTNSAKRRDNVFLGLQTVLESIRTVNYPTKVSDYLHFLRNRSGQRILELDFMEVLELHGINIASFEPSLFNPIYKIPGLDTQLNTLFSTSKFDSATLSCIRKDYNQRVFSLNSVSSDRPTTYGTPKSWQRKRTTAFLLTSYTSMLDKKAQLIPNGGLFLGTFLEGSNSPVVMQDTSADQYVGNGLYETSLQTYYNTSGYEFNEFLNAGLPNGATQIQWMPFGKFESIFGYLSMQTYSFFSSREIGDGSSLDYDTRMGGNLQEFRKNISPTACQAIHWEPIGKQPYEYGRACWTAVGFWGTFIFFDECSNLIEKDQLPSVIRSPVFINDRWEKSHDIYKMHFQCELHSNHVTEVLEIDNKDNPVYFPSNTVPNTTHWNEVYRSRTGRIRYLPPQTNPNGGILKYTSQENWNEKYPKGTRAFFQFMIYE